MFGVNLFKFGVPQMSSNNVRIAISMPEAELLS